MTSRAIAWFRRDLRLEDNPAWARATLEHDEVVAVFVRDPMLIERAGSFRRAALLEAVDGLDADLTAIGSGLHVVDGDPVDAIPELARSFEADAVWCNHDVTPYATARDTAVRTALSCPLQGEWGSVVQPPGSITTDAGSVPRVFAAFWRRWNELPVTSAIDAGPARLHVPPSRPPGAMSRISTATRALHRLEDFCAHGLGRYADRRDLPAIAGTSELSVDLKLGTLAASAAVQAARVHGDAHRVDVAPFVRQLAWRDWWAHLLAENPSLVVAAQRPEYDRIRWRDDPDGFAAWKAGGTGFPIVDAGMRELRTTGRMHNRVRMIAASFLVKDLLIDWRAGERYFRHLLADGDVAQNAGNWQWVAGTGPDAAPYFRVFNPVVQSRKFDPHGVYLRRWLPELGALADDAIHEPSRMGPLDLAGAGITLGIDYPLPIVDHAVARRRAIEAYQDARRA